MASSAPPYDSTKDTLAHIGRVRDLLHECVGHLHRRAALHDKSKLEEPEKAMYDEFTPKLGELEYSAEPDSPYQQTLREMGPALQHHYAENRHHPEWHEHGVHGMNLLDVLEMLADWKAAGERHGGDLMRSIEKNAKRFGYGMEFRRLLENTARDLGWA